MENNVNGNNDGTVKKDAEKGYAIKFLFKDNQIQIQMQAKAVSPHEMIGLLEMAKKQILDGMQKNNQ
jgi:hypothetical protein